MATIHPSAVLEGDIDLADDVVVGPHCVLQGPIRIGAGTRLIASVHLHGRLVMGESNTVWPGTCLGFAAQDLAFAHEPEDPGLVIGDDNRIREMVTIHRATGETPTTVGDGNYLMAQIHVGHDCRIADRCVIASLAVLAGHVWLDDDVVFGGGASIHQFCRVGAGALVGGGMGTGLDVPPWFMLTGTNTCGHVNLVGMRRHGKPPDFIEEVRWVYGTLYRSGVPITKALDQLRQRAESPLVASYVDFIESSRRGICGAHIPPDRRKRREIIPG